MDEIVDESVNYVNSDPDVTKRQPTGLTGYYDGYINTKKNLKNNIPVPEISAREGSVEDAVNLLRQQELANAVSSYTGQSQNEAFSDLGIGTNSFDASGPVDNTYGSSKYDEGIWGAPNEGTVDNQRFDNQNGLTQIGFGLVKGVNTAATTFVGGLYNTFINTPLALVEFAKSLGDDDKSIAEAFSDMMGVYTEDSFNQALEAERSWLDDVLPQYRSWNQQNGGTWTTDNILSCNGFGDLLNTMGFTVGAFYSGGVTGKVLQYAGKGISALGNVASQTKLAQAASAAVNSSTKTAAALNAVGSKLNTVGGMAVKGLQAMSGAMGEGLVEGISATKDWVTEQRNILKQDCDRRRAELDAEYEKALDEAGTDPLRRAIADNDYIQKKQKIDTDEISTINQILVQGDQVGRMTAALNIPILTFEHAITFGRAFNGGFNTLRSTMQQRYTPEALKFIKQAALSKERALGRSLTKDELRQVEGLAKRNMKASGIKLYEDARELGKWDYTKAWLKTPLSEGTEEMSQKMASNAAGAYNVSDVDNYYFSRFNPDAIDTTRSKLYEAFSAAGATLSDPEAWYEFAVGALCGAMGSPAFRSSRKSKVTGYQRDENGVLVPIVEEEKQFPIYLAGGIKDELKALREDNEKYNSVGRALNEYVSNGHLDKAINSLISQTHYSNAAKAHLENGDKFNYKNAELRDMLTSIERFADAGRLDDLKQIVRSFEMQAQSDKALAAIQASTNIIDENGVAKGPYSDINVETEEGRKEMRQRIKKHTEEMVQSIDTYAKIRKDLDAKSGGRLSGNQLACLSWYKTHVKEWERRSKELMGGRDNEGNETPVSSNAKSVRDVITKIKDNIKAAMAEKAQQFDDILDPSKRSSIDPELAKQLDNIDRLLKSPKEEEREQAKKLLDDFNAKMVSQKEMWGDSYIELSELLEDALTETDDEEFMRKLIDPLVTSVARPHSIEEYRRANLMLNQILSIVKESKAQKHSDAFYDRIGKSDEREDMFKALFDVIQCRNAMAKYEALYKDYMTNPELMEAMEQEAEKKKAETIKRIEVSGFEKELEACKSVSEVYDKVLALLKSNPDAVDSINDAIANQINAGNKIVEQFNKNQLFIKDLADSLKTIEIDYDGESKSVEDKCKALIEKLLVEASKSAKSTKEILDAVYSVIDSLKDEESMKKVLEDVLSYPQIKGFLSSAKISRIQRVLKTILSETLDKSKKDKIIKAKYAIPKHDESVKMPFDRVVLEMKKFNLEGSNYVTTAEQVGVDESATSGSSSGSASSKPATKPAAKPGSPKPEAKKVEGFGEEGLGGNGQAHEVEGNLDIKQMQDDFDNDYEHKFWFPAIPMFALSERKQGFTTRNNHPKSIFKNIYDELESRYDAFEYIDKHPESVAPGTTVYFAVDKDFSVIKYTDKNGVEHSAKQVLICIKDGDRYQVVGTLTRNEEACKKFPGMKTMLDSVLADAEKSSDTFFVSDKTRTVANVAPGLVEVTKGEERPVSEAIDGMANPPIFAYVDKNGLAVDESLKGLVQCKAALKLGRIYMLVKTAVGTYVPMEIRTKHYNSSEVDSVSKSRIDAINGVLQEMVDLSREPKGSPAEEQALHDKFDTLYGRLNDLIALKAYGVHVNFLMYGDKHRIEVVKNEVDENGAVKMETVEVKGTQVTRPSQKTIGTVTFKDSDPLINLSKLFMDCNVSFQVTRNDVENGLAKSIEDDIVTTDVVKGGAAHTKGSYIRIALTAEGTGNTAMPAAQPTSTPTGVRKPIGKRTYEVSGEGKVSEVMNDGALSTVSGIEAEFVKRMFATEGVTTKLYKINGEDVYALTDKDGTMIWEGASSNKRIRKYESSEHMMTKYANIEIMCIDNLYLSAMKDNKRKLSDEDGDTYYKKMMSMFGDPNFVQQVASSWRNNNHGEYMVKNFAKYYESITDAPFEDIVSVIAKDASTYVTMGAARGLSSVGIDTEIISEKDIDIEGAELSVYDGYDFSSPTIESSLVRVKKEIFANIKTKILELKAQGEERPYIHFPMGDYDYVIRNLEGPNFIIVARKKSSIINKLDSEILNEEIYEGRVYNQESFNRIIGSVRVRSGRHKDGSSIARSGRNKNGANDINDSRSEANLQTNLGLSDRDLSSRGRGGRGGITEYYKDSKGRILGYRKGNTIYIINKAINANTPVHEYAHIWAEAVKKNNPELWAKIKDVLRETDVWKEFVEDIEIGDVYGDAYSNLVGNEDAIASEVIARLSGTQNEKELADLVRQGYKTPKSLLAKIKDALNKFWKAVAEHVFKMDPKHIKTWEDVAHRVMYDFYNGTDLRDTTSGETPESPTSKTTPQSSASTVSVTTTTADENDTVGASPVALSYLLEGGPGTITSIGYFLHGVAAAFPAVANKIEEIRDRYLKLGKLQGSPSQLNSDSNDDYIIEIERAIEKSYGHSAAQLFREKFLPNASGFIPSQGKQIEKFLELLGTDEKSKATTSTPAQQAQSPAPVVDPKVVQAQAALDELDKTLSDSNSSTEPSASQANDQAAVDAANQKNKDENDSEDDIDEDSIEDLIPSEEFSGRYIFSEVTSGDSGIERIDIPKELLALRQMIPGLTRDDAIAIVDRLFKVGDKGVVAQGAFSRGLITVSRQARRGTLYHEGFHAVFDTCLNEDERRAILDEAKDHFGSATDAMAEEALADAFRDYMIEQEDMTIGKRIKNFFKELFRLITFQSEVTPYANRLFDRIRTGAYKKSEYKFRTLAETRRSELRDLGFSEREINSIEHFRTGFNSRDYDTQSAILESGLTEEQFDMLPADAREELVKCL